MLVSISSSLSPRNVANCLRQRRFFALCLQMLALLLFTERFNVVGLIAQIGLRLLLRGLSGGYVTWSTE